MGAAVTLSGPLFDGRLQRDFNRAMEEAADEAAEEAKAAVQRADRQVFRTSTGHTSSRVTIRRTGPMGFRITGGGLVWRPWLEGTAPRNRKSRYKGGRPFQRAARPAEVSASQIVERRAMEVLR